MCFNKRLILISVTVSVLCSITLFAQEKEKKASYERNRLHILNQGDVKFASQLKEIDKLATLNRWGDIIKIYTKTLKQYKNKVVAIGDGRYLSAEKFIIKKLFNLPEEGKREFRIRFDPPAERLFEKAKENLNTSLLQEIIADYPLSNYAVRSLILLGDIALEKGDFSSADSCYTKVLKECNITEEESKLIWSKALAAASGAGLEKSAESLLSKVKTKKKLNFGCGHVRLTSFIENLPVPNTQQGTEHKHASNIWDTVGGNNSRNRNSTFPLSPAQANWIQSFINYYPSQIEYLIAVSRSMYEFSYFPIRVNNKILIATEYSLSVKNIENGEDIITCSAPNKTNILLSSDIIVAPVYADFNGKSKHLVFVNFVKEIFRGEDFMGLLTKASIPQRNLYAINPDTGKIVWNAADDSEFKKAFANKRWSFGAPPIVIGNTLYAEIKVRSQMVISYLVAFDALRGTLKWSLPLVSNGTELTMFGYDAREPLSTMITASEDERTLFVSTCIGAVCAIDAITGSIEWITEYEQIPLKPPRGYYTQSRQIVWANYPPIVAGSTLITAPLDSQYIYAIDTAAGTVKWRIKYDEYGAPIRQIAGVSNGKLFISGSQIVALDIETGKLKWRALQGVTTFGCPAIAGKHLYALSADKIATVDTQTGKVISTGPFTASNTNNRTVMFGNVSIFEDIMIITERNCIISVKLIEKTP
ncbi:MAG: PQQ-binding-like beta-propeller repeat protein [Planctomycetota bacterium]